MNETSIERKHRMMVLDTCKAPGEIEVRPSMDDAQPHPLDLMHAALGIAGEAGEVVDLIKKVAINGRELSLVDLTKELGDLEWYLTLLRSITGIDRQVCLEMNIEKLRARYFDGYSDKASLERIDVRTPEAFFERRDGMEDSYASWEDGTIPTSDLDEYHEQKIEEFCNPPENAMVTPNSELPKNERVFASEDDLDFVDPQECLHPKLEWGGISGYVCSSCGTPAAAVQEDIA